MLADLDAHAVSDGANVTSDGKIHAANLILLKGGKPTPKPVDITYKVIHSLKDNDGQIPDLAVPGPALSPSTSTAPISSPATSPHST